MASDGVYDVPSINKDIRLACGNISAKVRPACSTVTLTQPTDIHVALCNVIVSGYVAFCQINKLFIITLFLHC